MKSVLETLVITAGLAFVIWLIVSVGLKFEVKIHGKEYGFSVGAGGNDAATLKYLQIYNAFSSIYYVWADKPIMNLPDRDNCIRYTFPRYENVDMVAADDSSVFFIIFQNKNILPIEEAYKMGISFSKNSSVGYSVI